MRKVQSNIRSGLFELLKEKELSEISIVELIEKSNVCRASFYRNYYSVLDVVDEYLMELFENIENHTPITDSSIIEHSAFVYDCFLKEKEYLMILHKRELLYLLDKYFLALCQKQAKLLDAYINEYQTAYFAGATSFIIKTWIKNNFRETSEEILKITSQIMKASAIKLD